MVQVIAQHVEPSSCSHQTSHPLQLRFRYAHIEHKKSCNDFASQQVSSKFCALMSSCSYADLLAPQLPQGDASGQDSNAFAFAIRKMALPLFCERVSQSLCERLVPASTNRTSITFIFPPAVFHTILSFLSARELARAAHVSLAVSNAVLSESLWLAHFSRDFAAGTSTCVGTSLFNEASWRSQYAWRHSDSTALRRSTSARRPTAHVQHMHGLYFGW
jgi:hypothetical protein